MNLQEYLKKTEITVTKFADEIDITRGHLSDILHMRERPSLRLMQRIEKATKGKVTVEELITLYYKNEHNE